MSLDNPTKTNWTSDDGVRLTDINNIEENIQALEDSKYESGDSPTFGDTNVEDLTASGAITPTSSAVESSFTVTASSTLTIPIGVYMLPVVTSITVQIYINSTWTASEEGGVFSDGVNVRLSNASAGDITVYYLKF